MIKEIISNFKIYGDFIDAKPFGNGHINDTYLVKFNQAGIEVKYILRKINKFVFKNPEAVVNNTVKVYKHISKKLIELQIKEVSNHVMQLVESNKDNYHFEDENNDFWCVVLFIDNAYTVEKIETEEQAYRAAKAFGQFQSFLLDANANEYQDTIPNFHNLKGRLIDFELALKNDLIGRVKQTSKEIEIANSYRYLEEKITLMIENKELPIRVTHNDTKINNVMLNKKTDIEQCVIDLDTVMPGIVLYDFGDMVRTFTSPAEEDEKELSKVTMRIEIFEKLIQGYLTALGSVLSKIEIDNLIYGALVITYEQLIRFLTDYLNGDIYYSTKYDEHNLVRTRTQIALLESIIEQKDKMEIIVTKYRSN